MSDAFAANTAFDVRRGADADAASGGGDNAAAPAAADAAADAADADFVWEFEPAAVPRRLRRGQRTNHFPGYGSARVLLPCRPPRFRASFLEVHGINMTRRALS
jgi:hypothetical protein